MLKLSKYLFIVLSAITTGLLVAVFTMAFIGPGANQPPDGSPTASLGGVPSGAVMFFNLGVCPSGWTEYTMARGRVIVGTPLSGTNASTTGTALTNLGTRTITNTPSHLHSIDPAPTASGTESADHTHAVNPPSTSVSISDPGHYHASDANYGSNHGFADGYKTDWTNTNTAYTGITASVDIALFTSGAKSATHTHTTDIVAFNSASTGSASVDVTMPYIQLRACSKD